MSGQNHASGQEPEQPSWALQVRFEEQMEQHVCGCFVWTEAHLRLLSGAPILSLPVSACATMDSIANACALAVEPFRPRGAEMSLWVADGPLPHRDLLGLTAPEFGVELVHFMAAAQRGVGPEKVSMSEANTNSGRNSAEDVPSPKRHRVGDRDAPGWRRVGSREWNQLLTVPRVAISYWTLPMVLRYLPPEEQEALKTSAPRRLCYGFEERLLEIPFAVHMKYVPYADPSHGIGPQGSPLRYKALSVQYKTWALDQL